LRVFICIAILIAIDKLLGETANDTQHIAYFVMSAFIFLAAWQDFNELRRK